MCAGALRPLDCPVGLFLRKGRSRSAETVEAHLVDGALPETHASEVTRGRRHFHRIG